VTDIASAIGPEVCKALPGFHAFTGCDCYSIDMQLVFWDIVYFLPPVFGVFGLLLARKDTDHCGFLAGL